MSARWVGVYVAFVIFLAVVAGYAGAQQAATPSELALQATIGDQVRALIQAHADAAQAQALLTACKDAAKTEAPKP